MLQLKVYNCYKKIAISNAQQWSALPAAILSLTSLCLPLSLLELVTPSTHAAAILELQLIFETNYREDNDRLATACFISYFILHHCTFGAYFTVNCYDHTMPTLAQTQIKF